MLSNIELNLILTVEWIQQKSLDIYFIDFQAKQFSKVPQNYTKCKVYNKYINICIIMDHIFTDPSNSVIAYSHWMSIELNKTFINYSLLMWNS